MFVTCSRTGQGYITSDEFRTILADLGEFMEANEVRFNAFMPYKDVLRPGLMFLQIEDLIYEADSNNDGCIYYENFAEQLFAWD